MLYHKKFRDRVINTAFGDILLDSKGFSDSLNAENEKIIGELPDWEIVSNKVEAKDLKKEEPKKSEEPKEDIELDENTIILGYSKEELEAMNVNKLKSILDDNKVEYPASIKKAKLIAKILEIQ